MLNIICRVILGIVFVFSGFVKAVDPQGSAIKIAEYLEIIGLHNFETPGLILAIVLSTLEFAIGFLLLFNLNIKKISPLAFVFMAFFTILTLYSAIYAPVSDCGCFGDAVKLTNWETFFKNLFLLPLSFYIYKKRNRNASSLSALKQNIGSIISILFIVGISVNSIQHLPLLDFRPYKVGTNIEQGMSIPEGAPETVYETSFILEKDGEKKEFDEHNYPYNDTTWVFVEAKTKVVKEGYQAPIQNFILQSEDGLDISSDLIKHDKPVYLLITPKIEKASEESIEHLKAVHKLCMEKNFLFYVATASLPEDYYSFDSKHSCGFEYINADETLLKTICRGNPGLVILYKGTIIAKYMHSDIPSINDLDNTLSHSIKSLKSSKDQWIVLFWALALLGIIVLLYRIK
ncbi:BT_3928 family protein [Carboxylicivirga sp. N1Y90]|uniref:BT_3928 family protein n=1 Tax=Carboxylicivirga fragile TaxID=3417571 RepID=UPI003D32C901|nr:DoxX family protein [Marinilabiliaceae bacterium N1Y90]